MAPLPCLAGARAVLIFLAIAAPWHIAASLVEPIFPWFYFINEHVLRFLGKREPHDYYAGSWWYYLPRMALYLFPWSFLLVGLVGGPRAASEEDEKSATFPAVGLAGRHWCFFGVECESRITTWWW